MSVMERFVSKFVKCSQNSCWEWTDYRNSFGYGRLGVAGQNLMAHRVSWLLFNGHIPRDKMVLHKCNNPSCVNPDHLYLGDARDNANDAVRDAIQRVVDTHDEQSVSTFASTVKCGV